MNDTGLRHLVAASRLKPVMIAELWKNCGRGATNGQGCYLGIYRRPPLAQRSTDVLN